MGEGTIGMSPEREGNERSVGGDVTPAGREIATRDGEGDTDPQEIERQIETLRAELGALVRELDRRRHEVLDVRLQLRRHAGGIALALACLAAVVAGGVAIAGHRRRRANSPRVRAANLVRALAVLSEEDPDALRRALEGRPRPSALGALTKLATLAAPRLLVRATSPRTVAAA
jgi:hypothetical protein